MIEWLHEEKAGEDYSYCYPKPGVYEDLKGPMRGPDTAVEAAWGGSEHSNLGTPQIRSHGLDMVIHRSPQW